jgi:hypothetical protein
MPEKTISFEDFELPFMKDPYEDLEDEEEDPDRDEIFESMESTLPSSARSLGNIEDEVLNFTSWEINFHFYILPLDETAKRYALIRINWDDNWGRWEWSGCAQATGYESADEAAAAMVEGLFRNWNIDLDAKDGKPYRKFVDKLRSKK